MMGRRDANFWTTYLVGIATGAGLATIFWVVWILKVY